MEIQAKSKARQFYLELTGTQYPYSAEMHTYIHPRNLLKEGARGYNFALS